MNYLDELKERFQPVLAALLPHADTGPLLEMIRPTQDPKLGDFQANFAMALSKRLGRDGPELAQSILDQSDLAGLCESAEVAGKGFINLRICNERLAQDINAVARDSRLGVPLESDPRTVVIDYSSPNIAKPMHVGHIRSTVIGDSISRILRFMGHNVITDNHIGDWGTQFGMILYGYKHFRDDTALAESPVTELSRLYRLVNKLIGYQKALKQYPELEKKRSDLQAALAESIANDEAKSDKKTKKARKQLDKKVVDVGEKLEKVGEAIASVEDDQELRALAEAHSTIAAEVLAETAKLHEGDTENLALWEQFLPSCRDEMQKIYKRLDIEFDHELGESFYHDQLAGVVQSLTDAGLAKESDGAMCVFLEGFDAPMIVQKQDGAFLYATTDLATIDYRVKQWNPNEILYVVDDRQGEHFQKLFAATKLMGVDAKLTHVQFGKVLGEDGRPFMTRAGAVGLEWLLDLAVAGALQVVSENDDAKPNGPELESAERSEVARTIGHAAVKYFDLSHNRESDYRFDEKRMVAVEGNTATYMQYSYARIASIIRRSEIDIESLRADDSAAAVVLNEPEERALALEVLQLQQALDDSMVDYRPNMLTAYVFGLAAKFSTFFEKCHVLKSDEPVRSSRLLLCDTVGRTIQQVLALLGIQVVKRM